MTGAQCVPETTISAAQIINALVVLTTIHAPDFEDAAGDRLDGRLTLPVAFPRGSRFVMAAMLLGWSAFLVRYWATGTVCTTVLLGLGTLAGVRFLLFDDAKADHTSFRLYTVRTDISQSCLSRDTACIMISSFASGIGADSTVVLQAWLCTVQIVPFLVGS